MKQINLIFLTLIVVLAFSCNKDEDIAKPTITLEEVGYNNTGVAYQGNDLHIEAELEAEGVIQHLEVELHPEFTGNWEFDSVFTEFAGLKNSTFHKHVEIPVIADTGMYHLHITITDQEGQQSSAETDVHIQALIDNVDPTLNITASPTANQLFTDGESISIEGVFSDDMGLGGMYIGLVRVDQQLADGDMDATNTITLLHKHDFGGSNSYNFNASILVNASQDNNTTPKDLTTGSWWQSTNYYILVKGKDIAGNTTFSAHYPIQIQI
jgi:hypothetical protein